MSEGGPNDLFDPRRLRKLWEKPEEDAFEKREREEAELREVAPAIVALDVFDEIVQTCRRRLGARVAKLEPLLRHARGLLAMKLASEQPPPPPPPAETPAPAGPAAGKKPPAKKGFVQQKLDDNTASLKQDPQRIAENVQYQIKRAFSLARLDKKSAEQPEAKPAELGAALDAIEDLFEMLSYGDGAAPSRAPGASKAGGGSPDLDAALQAASDAAQDLLPQDGQKWI